ncbi:MAG: hypothetical protein ACO3EZ_00325 [Prochlorotrichaceae cyanobacterium]|jgi:hypothetical protein
MNSDSPLSQTLLVNTLKGILSVQRQLQEDQIRSDEQHHDFVQNLSLLQQQLEQILIVQRNLQLDQLHQQDQTNRLLDQIDKVLSHQIKQQDLIDKIIEFNLSYMERF